jgi:hypothetical protein
MVTVEPAPPKVATTGAAEAPGEAAVPVAVPEPALFCDELPPEEELFEFCLSLSTTTTTAAAMTASIAQRS